MPTDKDNVFTSFKWDKVDHMMYYENYRLFYDREWNNGLRFTTFLEDQKYTDGEFVLSAFKWNKCS